MCLACGVTEGKNFCAKCSGPIFNLEDPVERTVVKDTVRMRRSKRVLYAAMIAVFLSAPLGFLLAVYIVESIAPHMGYLPVEFYCAGVALVLWPLIHSFLKARRDRGEVVIEERLRI